MVKDMEKTTVVGAVAYDPKVVTIWEGMRTYFEQEAKVGVEILLFQSYESQNRALLDGRIDIAWNTNLAYVQAEIASRNACMPIAMRDADLDWKSHILVPAGSPLRQLADLRGKTVALGSRDSGHAAILPTHFLQEAGLSLDRDYKALRFDTDVGKHGDTGRSEVDVVKAVLDGRADAGAVGSPFLDSLRTQSLVPAGSLQTIWTSPPFTHCMFTGRPGLSPQARESFAQALFSMNWENPRHRPILEAEGLRRWVPPTDGYASLRQALARTAPAIIANGAEASR